MKVTIHMEIDPSDLEMATGLVNALRCGAMPIDLNVLHLPSQCAGGRLWPAQWTQLAA